MRLALVLALITTLVSTPLAAVAGDAHGASQVQPDRERTRADRRVPGFSTPAEAFRRHERRVFVVPQLVFVSPGRCWQAGYWSYQWVPQSYSYSTWVAGQWSPEGDWIEGHYEPAWYTTGYYQPLWTEGYWTRC